LWSSGAWAADDDSEPPRLWATSEEALLREPAFREISERDIVDARRKVDERIQKFGQDGLTRAEIVQKILDANRVSLLGGSYEPRIAYLDEIDRRFGQDEDAAVRAVVVKALIEKGDLLRIGSDVEISRRGRYAYPAAALAVYDEIERRFGQETHSAIRAQYVHALVEKGLAWQINDPDAEMAAYDEVIRRFGEDKTPGVQAQVVYALTMKADATWSRIPYEFVLWFGEPVRKCRKSETRQLIVAYREDERQFKTGAKDVKKAVKAFAEQCRKPDLKEVVAIYDEIDRRFGKDEAPEVEEKVINAFFRKSEIVWDQKNPQMTIAVYEEINRRFGKENYEVRHRISDSLISRADGSGYFSVYAKNLIARKDILDLVDQWFGQDDSPNIQDNVLSAFLKKADILQKEGDLKAAFSVCNEADRRFEKRRGMVSVLDKKGAILQQLGDYGAALAVYDDIERYFGLKNSYAAALSLSRKGEVFGLQGKHEDALEIYDEIIQRFYKESYPAVQYLVSQAIKARDTIKAHLSGQKPESP
jgi:tetratricopeptide (TPR) repeat protein